MRAILASLALALTASFLGAAPPKPPATVTLRAGEITSVEIAVEAGKELGWGPGFGPEQCFVDEAKPYRKDTARLIVSPKVAGVYRVILWTVGEREFSTLVIDASGGPGPKPPDPPPVPPDPPTPAPAGFRVIFVFETSQPLTPAMQRVMFGEQVRTYLDVKAKGWRRFDKDVDATNEKDADIKALWLAARPKVTTVPCVIVAVGGKADILPFPATEDDALALFKKYAEGK